ncbi:pyridoxamine 5'-phosphate oxidase family protein [Agromyces sp. Marseille-P2726]|uniref:pyridoxamine 5'-phosphate oxidase family protein n=1 Tax=Agromyces sp. Marseille-P2726 TaxID=2709132 RepID=UPI0035300ED3
MATHENESSTDAARHVIEANEYLTLATADATGRPWATPVWFAERDLREFVWSIDGLSAFVRGLSCPSGVSCVTQLRNARTCLLRSSGFGEDPARR